MKILVASGNQGKLRELRRLAEGLPVEVIGPGDLDALLPEVEEDGATFAENAAKKALAAAHATGLPTLADDSGICVDALGGAPGVRSARYSGDEPAADRDEQNNRKLLLALRDVPPAGRSARFVCALCLAFPDGTTHGVEGRWEGQVAFTPRGVGGFGYDPLFLLPHLGKTAAELAPEEKGRLSHRGRAMAGMRALLEGLAQEAGRSPDAGPG
jgi:XTP/dITP diphosphohydrolase